MSRSRVFVAYPWVPYDRDAYKACYRGLEAKHDVDFVFAEDRLTSDQLIAKVERLMTEVDFSIVDLTDLNFNVALEYGLARGLRYEVYIAFNKTVNGHDVPSDLRGLDSLRYTSLEELALRLDAFLAQALAPEERERRQRAGASTPPDSGKYDDELAREPAGDLLKKIRSRGHWTTIARPERYVPGRISYRNLAGTIGDAKVEGRPYTFPHTDTWNQFPQLGANWFGREFDLGYFLEHWRLFESGQFFHVRALAEDWPELLPQPQDFPASGSGLGVDGAALHIAEAVAFAAGLASSEPGTEPFVLRLSLQPVKDRTLIGNATIVDPFLPQHLKTRRTAMQVFEREWILPRTDLKRKTEATWIREEVQRSWQPLAREAIREFFDRFGWDPGDDRLAQWTRT